MKEIPDLTQPETIFPDMETLRDAVAAHPNRFHPSTWELVGYHATNGAVAEQEPSASTE